MLNVNDFVINKTQIENIVKNSVGLVKCVQPNTVVVYFIGKDKNVTVPISNVEFLDVKKTGKPYKMKICNRCFILKEDYVDFEPNQNDKQGRSTTRPTCKDCRVNIDGVNMPASEKARMERIRPKPYQLFTCPICGKVSIPFVTANLVIDHNHKTGKARGYLCDSCNTGLGRFKDDIATIEKAVEYLKQKEREERGLF